MERNGIVGDGLQTYTADGAVVCAEIGLQERLRQADGLENLGAAVAADGRDAHLGHNLEKAFLDGLDIVGLGGGIVFLYLALLDEVVEDGIGHVGAEGRRTISQKQGGVHHLADLARLDDEGCLDALAH